MSKKLDEMRPIWVFDASNDVESLGDGVENERLEFV